MMLTIRPDTLQSWKVFALIEPLGISQILVIILRSYPDKHAVITLHNIEITLVLQEGRSLPYRLPDPIDDLVHVLDFLPDDQNLRMLEGVKKADGKGKGRQIILFRDENHMPAILGDIIDDLEICVIQSFSLRWRIAFW